MLRPVFPFLRRAIGALSQQRRPTRQLRFDLLESRYVPAPFTAGNVVIYRVGTGVSALGSAATEVFLDEYSPTGPLVQSVAMPTADSGANQMLTAAGTPTSEGFLTRSADQSYLILTGYDAAPGTASIVGTSSTVVPRVIGRVDVSASVDTTTTTTSFSTNNIRSATSSNGTDFWAVGSNTGVVYTVLGASGQGTIVSSDVTNIRVASIFDGQLYVSSDAVGFRGVSTVGTGLPTSTGQPIVRLPGLADATSPSDYAFFFADLSTAVAGNDTLYIADDSAGALMKWSLVGGTWVQNGAVGVATDLYRGLTGIVSGTTVTLFATRKGSELVKIVDPTGYNATISATPTLLATAANNTAFRGVALTPLAPNNAPVNTLPSTFSAVEDTVTALAGISVGDPDAGSADIKVTLSIPTGKGVLTLRTDVSGGLTAGQITNNGTRAIDITAPLSAINATLSNATGLKYNPAANLFGDVVLTMVANDLGNTGSGGARSDTDTSTIAIAPVADTPTVTDAVTDEEVQSTDGLAIAPNAADGSEVTHFQITAITNGSLYHFDGFTAINDGDFITANEGAAGLKFTPPLDFVGTATFKIQASLSNQVDGLGGDVVTATITVDPINDAPVNSVPASVSTDEEQDFAFTGFNAITIADVDADTGSLLVTLFAANGIVTLGDTTGLTVTGNGTDTVVAEGPLVDLNAALSTMLYTPNVDFNGPTTLTVTADDQGNTGAPGAMSDTDIIDITVNSINDAPTVVVPSAVTTDEDIPYFFTGIDAVTIDDVDAEAGDLRVTLSSSNGTATLADTTGLEVTGNGTGEVIATGTLSALFDALATLYFTPTQDFFGAARLAIEVNDQGNTGLGGPLTASDVIAITVNPINDAPVLGVYQFYIPPDIASGSPVNPDPGDEIRGTDVESDGLTYAITGGDPDGVFSLDANGVIWLLDNTNLAAEYILEITVTDDGSPNESDTGTIIIAVNTPPTSNGIDDPTVNEDEGSPIVIDLGAAFDDAEEADEDLVYSVESNSNPGLFESVEIEGTTLTITPAGDEYGASDFTIRATDRAGEFAEAYFTATVNPVNDAPTLDPIDDVELDEDAGEQAIELSGLTVGPENEAADGQSFASIVATSDNTDLIPDPTIEFDSQSDTYTLKFTPIANAAGVAEITVTVTDDGGTDNGGQDTLALSFLVTVNPLPDAPFLDTAPITMLNAVPLKTIPEGTTIEDLVENVTEYDEGDAKGIAVVGVENTKGVKTTGTWEFSVDDGATWDPIGEVSPESALLLGDNPGTRVRFLPVASFNGFASINFKAWDQSNFESEGDKADTTTPDDTAYSAAIERAWIAVGRTTPKVDADGNTILTTVREDRKYSGAMIVKKALGLAALEQLPKKNLGIALTSVTTADGKWQYRLARARSWIDVGTVTAASALLLRPTDQLRFVPNPNGDGHGTIAFKTWDRSTGNAGSKVDASGNAFSVDRGSAILDIKAVNDAPVLDLSVPAVLNPIDPGGESGAAAFAALMSPGDVEGANVGVAIVGAKGHGIWEFRPTGGTWTPLETVSIRKALFLDASAEIRFKADADAPSGSAALSFKAWDRTRGVVDTRGPAIGTAVSKATEVLTIAIGNHAPALDTARDVTLPAVQAGVNPGRGVTVKFLLGDAFADADPRSLRGIAIVAADNDNGTWQYSLGGNVWVDIGTVSSDSAILLADVHWIRFVPDDGYTGDATIEYKAWDRTAGQAGDRIDTDSGLNSFSTEIESATISVFA